MKKLLLIGNLLLWANLQACAQDPALVVTFDCPFPASPYKGVLTACMRVRSAVEILYAQRHNQDDIAIMCDVVAGRLAQLNATVEQLVPDLHAMHPEDKEYMHTLIACMVGEVAQLGELPGMAESSALLITMAQQIKSKIVLLNTEQTA